MQQAKTAPKREFKTTKELAAMYGITPNTFRLHLKKDIPLLYAMKIMGQTGRKNYSPAQQDIIFKVWGMPI